MKSIEALKARLAALEFEVRFESDHKEKDHIANERDAVARKLDAMDCDGDIDGKQSRGIICDQCGQVIGLDPDEQCKTCVRIEVADDQTDDDLAWIAETERKMADLQRRIDAGEDIDMHGWLSENWLNKVTPDI